MYKVRMVCWLCFFLLSGAVVAQAAMEFTSPEGGIGSMAFASTCSLRQLVHGSEDYEGTLNNGGLHIRERVSNQSWGNTEQITYDFSWGDSAALYWINRGNTSGWEVYTLTYGGGSYWYLTRLVKENSGGWEETDWVPIDGYDGYFDAGMSYPAQFASTMTGNGVVHFAILTDAMELRYFTFNGVEFSEELVGDYLNPTIMWGFDFPQSWRTRNVSLAVGEDGVPHIVFSANQVIQPVNGGTLQTSKLFYATKMGGNWNVSILIDHGAQTGDAGLGASIAVAPDGTVAVASAYLPRAATGSPGVSQLRYLSKKPGRAWSREVIAQNADGYFSRDGERGTGLFPYLQIDDAGRPNIIFTDHASEHAGSAWSYSGQLRYATREAADAGTWQLKTIIAQPTNDAYLRRLDRPVLATAPKECGRKVAAFAVAEEVNNSSSNFVWIFNEGAPPPPPPKLVKTLPFLSLLLGN